MHHIPDGVFFNVFLNTSGLGQARWLTALVVTRWAQALVQGPLVVMAPVLDFLGVQVGSVSMQREEAER